MNSRLRRHAHAIVIVASSAWAVAGCSGKGTKADGGGGAGGGGAGGMSTGGDGGGGVSSGGVSGRGGGGRGGSNGGTAGAGGSGCPPQQPTANGICTSVGLRCDYPAATCTCVHPATQNTNSWDCR